MVSFVIKRSEIVNNKNKAKGIFSLSALLTIFVIVLICFSGCTVEPNTNKIAEPCTYKQADGFEPYQGWQDSLWCEMDDLDYEERDGQPMRAGHPSISVIVPESAGVACGATEKSSGEVKILTDLNKTKISDFKYDVANKEDHGLDHPSYYYNIVMEPTDTLTLTSCAPGGRTGIMTSVQSHRRGGVFLSTSPDPDIWFDKDDNFNSDEAVVHKLDSSVFKDSSMGPSWWVAKTIDLTKDEGLADFLHKAKDPDKIYLCISRGTSIGHSTYFADTVFEMYNPLKFESSQTNWEGKLDQVPYGCEQGCGVKVGFESFGSHQLTVDMTQKDLWYNRSAVPLEKDDKGDITIKFYADGSGTNWQDISTSFSKSQIKVYTENPVVNGAINTNTSALAEDDYEFAAPEDSSSLTFDGVNFLLHKSQPESKYWLVFNSNFTPSSSSPLGVPIVLEFSVKA